MFVDCFQTEGWYLKDLFSIYSESMDREAASILTTGEVDRIDQKAAIEICQAILFSQLVDIDDEESGMKVYNEMVPDLQSPGYMKCLVIRPDDQEFWDRCIQLSLEHRPVCGVGNPGIGKTMTTLYLLQQLLMIHKKPVVYTIRMESGFRDIFYEFVPVVVNGTVPAITVSVHNMFHHEMIKIASMKVRGAFFVVDSGTYENSCDVSSELFEARFIMTAANDKRHWGGSNFTKFWEADPHPMEPRRPNSKTGRLVYGRLWTGSQVLKAKPYITRLQGVDDEELLRRFRIVGGSMRDIIDFKEKEFTQNVEVALNLNADTVKDLAEGRYQFTFDQTVPSSILIGLGPDDKDPTLFKTTLKSDFVEERLASRHLKISWYAVLDKDNEGNRGNLFESYLRLKFSSGPVLFSQEKIRESHREKPPASKRERKNYQPVPNGMTIGSDRNLVRVSDMNAAVHADQTQVNMFYSKDESEPLIDMIFRVDNGYDAVQATIGKSHGAATAKIRTLKAELGLQDDEKLRIFFAVPVGRFREFETAPVNPLLDEEDLNNVFIYHIAVSDIE